MNGMKKLRSSRGETLAESLVSILIVALVSACLATMVLAASQINEETQQQDAQLQESTAALTIAAARGEDSALEIQIGSDLHNADVHLYRDETDRLASYGKRGGE